MSVTHTWSIIQLIQINDGTGTICEVDYQINSTEDSFKVDGGGRVRLNTENIENFVSYNDLTEEIVVNWVKETLGNDEVNLIESNFANWIEQIKNPPAPLVITTPLPWAI
jgi:hypothetical protein